MPLAVGIAHPGQGRAGLFADRIAIREITLETGVDILDAALLTRMADRDLCRQAPVMGQCRDSTCEGHGLQARTAVARVFFGRCAM